MWTYTSLKVNKEKNRERGSENRSDRDKVFIFEDINIEDV